MAPNWETTGLEKRAHIISLLPPRWKTNVQVPTADDLPDATSYPCQFLTVEEREITEAYTAEELADRLARGALRAVEVTMAFCHRATVAHEVVNCLSEVMFESALRQAEELDQYLKTHGEPIGPLHGVPISLKDQFRVEGAETSVGYVGWLGKKETRDTESELVKILRAAGAVIYVKTNVPTSLMAIETNNNVIGYTWNAYNRHLSSGGSSGGEASLIAMRGSILGLGTDVGASVRWPAGVSNLYGLKPSSGRLPYLGIANSMEGQNVVPSVVGPLAHNPSDLRFLVKVILASKPWLRDPNVMPLPWRVEEQQDVHNRAQESGLCFGVMRWDGMVMPHPPVQRAIRETVANLKAQGHEIIDWAPPSHAEAFGILFETFTADGGAEIHDTLAISGEIPVPQLAMSYGTKFGGIPVSSVTSLWALQKRKYEYQERYLSYWRSSAQSTRSGRPVDAVLLPVAPSASVEPGKGAYFGYTGVANVLDYVAAVVPVTRADREVDIKDKKHAGGYQPISDMDKHIWESYNPDIFHGAPVGVQVMCRRLEEEKVIAIVEEIAKSLRSTE